VYGGARSGDEKVQCFSCLSVTHLDNRDCANDFAIKAFEYGNASDMFGQGRFVLVHLHSTLSLRH